MAGEEAIMLVVASFLAILQVYFMQQRRKRRLQIYQLCMLEYAKKRQALEGLRPRQRRRNCRRRVVRQLWVQPRPQLWWDQFSTSYDNQRWKQHFRITRDTFDFIVEAVKPYMIRQITNWRNPIALPKRVAVALWRMATGCEYRTIQELFGIGRSTACLIFQEFITAVSTSLRGQFLRHPTHDEFLDIASGFRNVWGFPQCVGAVDGTHIPIIAPSSHRNDYYNRKGFYSMIAQAVCDHRGLFWDLEIGWPGKVHDARVFSNSTVYDHASRGVLFHNHTERFGDVELPLFIIGDPAYPLLPWLLKGYREVPGVTTQDQRYFNFRLSRARMIIECAFGRLKGRWRCILKRNDTDTSLVPTLVLACAVLHNICEGRGDAYEDPREAIDEEILEGPNQDHGGHGNDQNMAQAYRNALCNYINSNII